MRIKPRKVGIEICCWPSP